MKIMESCDIFSYVKIMNIFSIELVNNLLPILSKDKNAAGLINFHDIVIFLDGPSAVQSK